ncbi:bacteriophage replication O family protein [Escherichia coli 2848050]|nr:bacteriophage replication O family protein [Escherichia coli 2848050]
MTNTAKILNFGRGNFAEQERRVADIDDGYTRFANELLEAIASADLTARWICPYISRHLLSLNPLQARCRRYSRGER